MKQKVKHSLHELTEYQITYKNGEVITEYLTDRQRNAIPQRKNWHEIRSILGKGKVKI